MNEKLLWILLTIVGVVGVVTLGVLLSKLNKLIREKHEGFQSPQLSFRYSADRVNQLVENLEGKGLLPLFDRFSQLMAAMMAEVLIVLMVVAHNITDTPWVQIAMSSLSGVIFLTGTAETLILKKQPKAAGALSLIKWAAFALWTLAMFATLFIRSTGY